VDLGMMRLMLRLFLAFGLTMLMSACGSDRPATPSSVAATGDGAGGAPTAQSYILGAGDRMRISVFGEDRLSGEFTVNNVGQLSFPLIGNIDATGKTLADVQATIHDRLANGYVNDPRVTAEFVNFRPYFVLGEVGRPGQFPYADGLTLRQAIAAAGGFTYRAKRSRVYITKPGSAAEEQVDLNTNSGRIIRPGEVIRIGERFF
jgi:polysaccharide export outer membrane protein